MQNYNMYKIKGGIIYTRELHDTLKTGIISTDLKNKGGIYLIALRVLQKDSNTIVYSSIYYPDIFTDSLLIYLLTKTNFKGSFLFKECGDFYTVIDNKLGNHRIVETFMKKRYEVNNYIMDFFNSPYYKGWCEDVSLCNNVWLFDILKKSTTNLDIDKMISLIDLAIKKKYLEFFNTAFTANGEPELKNLDCFNDIYILKDCLFVVQNKDELLNKLSSMKISVKGVEVPYLVKEPKASKDLINSMTNFLCCLDNDYRNNLYKYQLSLFNHLSPRYKADSQLPRSKFSFKHIHLNIAKLCY